MSNSRPTIDALWEIEAEAAEVHQRHAGALEAARTLLRGAIVKRWGKLWKVTNVSAHRGVVKAYGVRYYRGTPGRRQDQIGARGYDLGTMRECDIVHLAGEVAEPEKKPQLAPKPAIWHPNHPGVST